MEDAWLDAMNFNRAQGLEQGLEEGREQGLEEGREQGLEEGRKQGLEEGREETLRQTVKAMLEMGVSRTLVANMLTTKFNMTEVKARQCLARA